MHAIFGGGFSCEGLRMGQGDLVMVRQAVVERREFVDGGASSPVRVLDDLSFEHGAARVAGELAARGTRSPTRCTVARNRPEHR